MSSNAELFWGEHAMFTVHCLNSLEGFLKSETASHSIANQPRFKIPNGFWLILFSLLGRSACTEMEYKCVCVCVSGAITENYMALEI